MADEILDKVTLDDNIQYLQERLYTLDTDDENFKVVSTELERLYKLKNEETKIKNSFDAEMERLQVEDRHHREDLAMKSREIMQTAKDAKKDRIVENLKTAASVAGTVIGTGATVMLARECMDFEKTGVVRTKAWPKIFMLFKK